MGMYESRGMLARSMKDLQARWDRARAEWDDPRSRAFGAERIEPLERDLRQATAAMEQMGALLRQIRSACG
jgi:hypothetical protein